MTLRHPCFSPKTTLKWFINNGLRKTEIVKTRNFSSDCGDIFVCPDQDISQKIKTLTAKLQNYHILHYEIFGSDLLEKDSLHPNIIPYRK